MVGALSGFIGLGLAFVVAGCLVVAFAGGLVGAPLRVASHADTAAGVARSRAAMASTSASALILRPACFTRTRWSGPRAATRRLRPARRGPQSRPGRAAGTPRHYPVDPPGASFLQTSRIRKLCEVPGAVLTAPTSPSGARRPTLHDEEPPKRACRSGKSSGA